MKTIWKYELKTLDMQFITMPKGAKILTVQVQNNTPCLWCLCDPHPSVPEVTREIHIMGTGQEVDWWTQGLKPVYIGTYQLLGGEFIGHVFDVQIDG